MSKVRNNEASRFQAPGPFMGLRPRLPNSGSPPFSAPGCAKHCVVTSAPLAGLKLHCVFVNQATPRPVLWVTGIGPGPNQFSVLLFPGAFRTEVSPPKLIG